MKQLIKQSLIFILVSLFWIFISVIFLYLVSILITKLWCLIPDILFYPSRKQIFISLCILWILRITFLPLNNQQGR